MRTPPLQHPFARRPVAGLALILVASTVTFAFLAGCGGGSNAPAESPQTSAPEETAPPADAGGDAAGGSDAAAAGDLGSRVFEQRCALCHGKSGMGDGAAAAGLNPKPRNLRDGAYMSTRTDEQLLEIIRNGKGAMPAWGKNNTLSEDEIQAVLEYIRAFAAGS